MLSQYFQYLISVTPLAGVWIEINSSRNTPFMQLSLPLRECGLKYAKLLGSVQKSRHSPCGSVDWNRSCPWLQGTLSSHSPCGSVDWNRYLRWYWTQGSVTPLAGVWIEIRDPYPLKLGTLPSLPLRECGLKYIRGLKNFICPRHSPCGSVDWNAWNGLLIYIRIRHSPCGSVDWNFRSYYSRGYTFGHSPCGSVDWNSTAPGCFLIGLSHSPCGSVDWN